MTPEILEYLLRATVIWLALLAYYFVAGRKTSFRFQRFFLLVGWLFGLLVPLLPSVAGEVSLPVANLPTISFSGPAVFVPTVEMEVAPTWAFTDFLPWLYLLGVLIFGARTLVQGWVREQYLRTGQRSTFNGYPVIRHARIRSPFATRGHIFLPATMTDADLEHTALIHESSHLRARHHYDKFLLTLGSILLWFHPLMWAYRRLLATVHEYEADAAVLQQVPARTYGLQLLHCSLGPARGLGLFSSPLKKRIEMITNKTSVRKLRILPLLGLCLLLLGLTVACSDLAEDVTVPINSENPFDNMEEDPFEHMEEPVVNENTGALYGDAEDLGTSMENLIQAIRQNVRYPATARSSGTAGKFRAKVSINKEGKIAKVDVRDFVNAMEGGPPAHPMLVIVGDSENKNSGAPEPELLRVELKRSLLSLGDFQPAMRNGKPHAAGLNIDVEFKLKE